LSRPTDYTLSFFILACPGAKIKPTARLGGDAPVTHYCNVLVNLDIFWLRDESLEDTANLPDPDVLALEIVEDLQAALEQFSEIAGDLEGADDSG
jgi:hypothetical protein